MGSNPVQAWISYRPSFHYCSSSVHYCKDLFDIHAFIRSSNIWLSYIHSRLLYIIIIIVIITIIIIIINIIIFIAVIINTIIIRGALIWKGVSNCLVFLVSNKNIVNVKLEIRIPKKGFQNASGSEQTVKETTQKQNNSFLFPNPFFQKDTIFKHHLFIFTLVSHGIEFKGISQNTHSFGSQITFTFLIIFKSNYQLYKYFVVKSINNFYKHTAKNALRQNYQFRLEIDIKNPNFYLYNG